MAECNWITYLNNNGLSVAFPVLSENMQFVETFEDNNGDYFLTSLFTKAQGKHPDKSDFSPSFFNNYGQFIGKMHALSKKYIPENGIIKRPSWDDKIMLDVDTNVPQAEELIFERFTELVDYIRNLPKDQNSFGLIHQDPHTGNLVIDDNGTITLFDFDDCTYSWYINDIALVFFYATVNTEKPEIVAAEFFKYFYDGYCQENELDSMWFNEIHYFLKLREIDIYSLIYNNYDGKVASSQWGMKFMKNRKYRIEHNEPYLELDFHNIL
jgi:Ser/Thr protein kinase RdoA (MazF antagonist)